MALCMAMMTGVLAGCAKKQVVQSHAQVKRQKADK
jgi:hypothetical protein